MKKVSILALLAICLSACGNKEQVQKELPALHVMTLEERTCDVPFDFPAQLKGKQDVVIMPQITAKLEKVLVEEGQKVEKGQQLFILNQNEVQAQVDNARAEVLRQKSAYETARLQEDAKRQLLEKNIISKHEYDVAKNQLQIAKAMIEEAEARLRTAENTYSHSVICSPLTGVVGSINFKQGALVGPNMEQPLTMVSDNSTMYAYVSFQSEAYQALMQEYGSKESLLDSMPPATLYVGKYEYEKKGHIATISGIIEEATGTISARFAFDNHEGKLLTGSSAKVVLNVQCNAIVLPRAATYEIQDKTYCYRVVDNKVVNTIVNVFRLNEKEYILMDNSLKKGDVIVTEGVKKLHNNDEITPLQ